MYHNYGPTVESLLSEITCDRFDKLEEVLKDPSSLKACDDEVKSYNCNGSLLSSLIYKLKDAGLQYKVCYLFLQYGLSFTTKVFKNLNILSFFCSLNKFNFAQIKIICLCIFLFKNEISFDSILKECLRDVDKTRLKKFFINKEGNFSVASVDMASIAIDLSCTSLLESFIDASIILNKNAITDGPWNCDIIFLLLDKIMQSLRTMQLGKSNLGRKNALLSTFETLLLAAVHPNSYEEQNKLKYLSLLETQMLFKDPQIGQEINALIKKHWGYLK